MDDPNLNTYGDVVVVLTCDCDVEGYFFTKGTTFVRSTYSNNGQRAPQYIAKSGKYFGYIVVCNSWKSDFVKLVKPRYA